MWFSETTALLPERALRTETGTGAIGASAQGASAALSGDAVRFLKAARTMTPDGVAEAHLPVRAGRELELAHRRLIASHLEKELKSQGKTLEQEKERICQAYRRRPLKKVMEEIEDEIKDTFSEHQLKIELIQIMEDELSDLSGANKPVEVKLFGPDQKQLRTLADDVAETLAKKGKGRGIHVLELPLQRLGLAPELGVDLRHARLVLERAGKPLDHGGS